MHSKIFITVAFLAFCLPQMSVAQMGRWEDTEGETLEDYIDWDKFHPFIEANYGLARPRFEGLGDVFNTLGLVEIKMGYGAIDSINTRVVSLDERYAFASYIGEDVETSSDNEEGKWSGELTRFGGGNRLGVGFGQSGGLRMYNQNLMNWTKVLPVDYDDMDPDVQAVFDRYENSFRFGQLMEAGVKLNLSRKFAITGGVEGAVIFPRHVFWPWLGSVAIYSGAEGLIQMFTDDIVAVSPVFGPVLQFLLKSGVSVGYYLLQQENMNWPFTSETPLTVESVKLGATISFG